MLCLARLMRCAMVVSGTRKARAISAVVQPADRAQCERELRRRREGGMGAEEEQGQRVVFFGATRDRRPEAGSKCSSAGTCAAAVSSRRRRAWSLRSSSVSRRGRHRDQPATWVLGDALIRPLERGGEQRLLHGVLGRVEVAVAADERAEDLRRELAQQVLGTGSTCAVTSPRRQCP